MIPVYQKSNDECIRACIASILEVSITHVGSLNNYLRYIGENTPLADLPDDIWMAWLDSCISGYGYMAHIVANSRKNPATVKGYTIGIGIDKEMNEHACVYKDGTLAHDPWKEGDGLVKVTKFVVLEKLDFKQS